MLNNLKCFITKAPETSLTSEILIHHFILFVTDNPFSKVIFVEDFEQTSNLFIFSSLILNMHKSHLERLHVKTEG